MVSKIKTGLILACSVLLIAGCSWDKRDTGTAVGAVAGGIAGHALGGDTASTVAGAAIGGVAGNQLSK